MSKNGGGNAFPFLIIDTDDTGKLITREVHLGMTLRQWYAGMALQGLCANNLSSSISSRLIALTALSHADALIAEESK